MSKYVMSQKSKKTQVWLQRLVKFWLASGMIAMPWMAYGSEIQRTDGAGNDVHAGNIHNIYAGKDAGNGVGTSTFSKFDVTAGDVANMHFRTSSTSTTHFNTLLNFVDAKININGTVNAIRNGGIGGHLYFLSPNGMAVGASGVINAGALSVLTPTQGWWDKKFDGSGVLKSDALKAIQDNTVPINSSGTIAVLGKINATDKIYMGAAKIDIGQSGIAANINTTTIDFSSVVNLSPEQQKTAEITNLIAKRDTNGGDIILAAEVSYNANPKMDGDKVNAELNVTGGSQIKAFRNVSLTAKALNNGNYLSYQEGTGSAGNIKYVVNGETLTEEQFKAKYGDDKTGGVFKTDVKTSAVINITGDKTVVEGMNVNIVAEAQNILDNSMTKSLGENAFAVGMSVLLNGFDVCLGDLTNKAEVNIDKGVTLHATGLDGTAGGNAKNALNVQALATTQITVGTWAGSIGLASVIPNPFKGVPSTGLVPSVMFNLAKGKNEANVNINGTLKANMGKINVGAIAKNYITSTADSGIMGSGLAGNSNAVLTIGINGVEGYNKSNIVVGSTAVIEAAGDVEMDSHAISSIIAKTSLTTTEKSTMAFGIGWLDYENLSTIDLSGAVKATGAITLDSMAKYTDNTFNVSVSAGKGFAANLFGDKFGVKKLEQGLLDKLSSKLGPAISKAITGEADNFAQDGVDGKTVAEKLADKLKLGISFGYMKEKNVANVTIQPTATIISSENKDITINSKATLEDVYTNVVGTSNNKEKYQTGSSSAAALVNGAVFLRNITNEGDLVIDARSDGNTAVIKGGKITLDVSATAPYNRVKYMVGQMTKYYNQINDIYPTWDNPSDEDVKVLKKYHEAAMAKKSEIEAGLYDDQGNLKPEYSDQKTGSAELLKKMNEFQQTKEYKDYYKLLTEGKYTDDSGKEKTIGGGKTSGALEDIMAAKNLLTKGLLQMINPQSYFSYSVASEVSSRDSKEGGASKFGIGIAFGMDSFNNNTSILVGKNAYLDAAKDVAINAKADYGDINCNGGYLTDSAGTTGANMDLVTIQHLNNNSIVAVAEGATIKSGENISAKVTNDVNHIGINKPILTSEGGVAVIDVAYFTTESNTILSVDDEVKLDAAKTISLTGNNTTKGIVFTGAIAAGDTKAGAVSVAYSDIDRNNIVGITDNDGVGALAQANKDNKNTKATDIDKSDDEDTRMKKLLATKSGMTQDKIISFYSNTLNGAGSVGANAFELNVATSGKLGNFVVDIAITSHDEKDDGKPGMLSAAASWMGDKLKSFIGLKKNTVNDGANGNQDMIEMQDLGGEGGDVNNNAGQQHMDNDGNEHQDAAQNQEPKLSLAGAGSGSFVELDAITASVVKNTTITLKNANAALKNTANDNSLLVTVAGGAAASKTVEVNGGDSSSYVLTGSVSINDVSSKLVATIGNCTISGAQKIDNLAIREGALANAAAAVSVVKTGGNSSNASGAFGAIVNLADYTTDAKLLNNKVNTTGSAVTDIINQATDKDIQITGGIDVNIVKGGKKATGVGGVVSWAYLNNKVNSVIENGDYKSLGALAVEAITDLTQINAALGLGVSSSTGGSTTFQGAGVRNKLVNNVKANIKSATITGKTLKVDAYDTNLSKTNAYDNALKRDYGFDVDGKTYISHAQTQTNDDDKTIKLEDSGNLIVSAAVEVAAATGAGSNASVGASAVVGIIDNDFNSIVEGSTITLSGDVGKTAEGNAVYPAKVWAESSTLQVGVAAGGNGSENGFAGGGSVVVNLFKNDVNAKVEGSTFNTAGLQVDAKNKQKLVNVAGQIDIGKSAVGLDMVFNYMMNNTGAYFTNSSIEKRTTNGLGESNLVLDAANNSDIYAIALGVSASDNAYGSTAANGSVAFNRGQNNVEAVAKKNAEGKLHLAGLKTFTVHSKDDSYLAAATGGLTYSAGKTALGGSLTWNRLGSLVIDDKGKFQTDDNKKQENNAIISGYDIHMANDGVLTVNAEDVSKFTTVAIGLGIGTANTKFTLQGANANAYLNKSTTASIVGGNINQDNKDYNDHTHFADVNVIANTDNTFKTYSLVLATSGKVAIGATLAENTMKADTKANLAAESGKGSSTYLVKDALVKATSKMTMDNIAVGVAASGKVAVGGSIVDNIINNNTKAELGGEGDFTEVVANGGVGVVSQSSEKLTNHSGQASFSFATVGGGIAVALNEIKGDTLATAQNAKVSTLNKTGKTIQLHDSIKEKDNYYTGFVVGADAFHNLYNAPFCASLTTSFTGGPEKLLALGLDVTVSTDNISGTTQALMKGVSYNETIDDGKVADGSNLTVLATDRLKAKSVVTNAVLTLALGQMGIGASVGAGVNVEKNSRKVVAEVDGDVDKAEGGSCNNIKRKINADKVTIKADSDANVDATNTAVSVQVSQYGGISFGTGVTYADLNVTTLAKMKGIESKNNGLSILANHKDHVDLVGTGVTVSISPNPESGQAAVGVHVDAQNNTSDTQALLENSNIYHYKNGEATDSIQATSDSYTHTQDANITFTGAVFGASVGVLVADNDLKETVKAAVTDSVIGTDSARAKDINVLSDNKVETKFNNQNVSLATIAGIGVGVGLNTVDTSVSANMANSTFYASNDINVKATESITLNGNMASANVGVLAVGVSTLHNYVGTAVVKEDYAKWVEDNKVLDEKGTKGETKSLVSADQMEKGEYNAKKIDGLTTELIADGSKKVDAAKKAGKTSSESTTGVTKKAARSETLNNTGDQVNLVNAKLNAGNNITTEAKEVVNSDTMIGGGSVGLLSVQVETNRQRITGKVGTTITDGSMQAGKDISVSSLMSGQLKNNTVQVGVGGVPICVTIGELTKQEGGTDIKLYGANMDASKGNISLLSKDDMAMLNKGTTVAVGAITASAVDYTAKDNSKSVITLKNDSISKGNILKAKNISLSSLSVPNVVSTFDAVSVSLVTGAGVVVESTSNNKAELNVQGTDNQLLADKLTLLSKVYADTDKYSARTDVTSGVYSLVSVLVNKSRTYSNVYATTSVDGLVLKTKKVKDENGDEYTVGLCDVTISAEDATNLDNSIKGKSNGLVAATGTNYAQTDIKNNVTTTVDAGKGLYAKNLDIHSYGKDTVTSKANGYGLSIFLNISPVGAGVETKIEGNTKTTLKGVYNVADTFSTGAIRQDVLSYTADSEQIGGVASAGGVKIEVKKSTENTVTELDDATINAGTVNVLSSTKVEVNNTKKSDAGVLDKKDKNYVVNGVVGVAGSVGLGISLADFQNIWEINNKVNVRGGKIVSDNAITLAAYTDAIMNVFVKVGSASAIYDGAFSSTKNDLTVNNMVMLYDGAEVRTDKEKADITIAASDNLVLDVRGSAENTASLAGTTKPKVTNTIHRNNGINIASGKVFSKQDINLLAGRSSSTSDSNMDLILTAISFNRGMIPAGYAPTLTNTIEQKNTIDVAKNSNVQAIRHVTLYADNGRESINKSVKVYGAGKDKDYGSGYVSTTSGSLDGAGIVRKNYVQVDGNVTAGIVNTFSITIGKAGDLVFLNNNDLEAIKAGDNQGKTIYSSDQKDSFVSLGEAGSEAAVAAETVGLTLDKFIFSNEPYKQTISKRLAEVNKLLGEYSADTDQTVYNGLLAESQRLEQILSDLYVDQNWDTVEYISIPDLVASGGNVIVNTRNFSGSGTVTAKGNPSVTITNYTNLTMKTNKITVDDPGGVIYYKNQALDPEKKKGESIVSLQDQVKALNADNTKTVDTMNAAKGTTATVTVKGMYSGSEVSYNHVDTDPTKSFSGTFKPKADVIVNGNVNSLSGNVLVYSDQNSITIEGKTVQDAVSVNGKVVNIDAPKGSITQGFTNGIVNIGGDVRSIYKDSYNSFVKQNENVIASKPVEPDINVYDPIEYMRKRLQYESDYMKWIEAQKTAVKSDKLIETELKDGQKAPEVVKDTDGNVTGNWIAGGQVFINAADININGVIQSGYDYYYVDTNKNADEYIAKITGIELGWAVAGRKTLQDDIVKGSGSQYKVVDGGAYWNATKGCYEYRMSVYYNPSTKQLLTEDVDVTGGRVYLTGRISSTGNGKIICLDGTYNIDVKNTLNYDLQVGKLVANDTKGKVTIIDSLHVVKNEDGSNSSIITEITSSGVVSKNAKTKEVVTNSQLSGSGRNYTYTPTTGLRYNWVDGYKSTFYTRFVKTDKSYFWGATKFYKQGTDKLDSWSADAKQKGDPVKTSQTPRDDGAYIVVDTNTSGGANYRHSGTNVGTAKYVYESEETSQSGWWIFKSPHIYHYTYFKKEQGQQFYDYASIKADNPISITFIGTSADNAYVNVETTKNLYVNGKIGNTQLYEVKSNDEVTGYVEKGTVTLTSKNASVIQQSNSIYGATVKLSAANDLQNINVTAGDTVNLTGVITGVGSAKITVDQAYGGAKGKVVLGNLGGSKADVVDLTADGDIRQSSSNVLVEAKRINISSVTGSVSGVETNSAPLRVKAGQSSDADGTDSLKASLNISAQGNISVEQVSGDLRVGKIRSEYGDVYIRVPEGSIIDALPYVDDHRAEDEKLLSQWRDMGVILNADGSKSSGRIQNEEMQKAAKNEAASRKDKVTDEYANYVELTEKKAKYEQYKNTVIQEYSQFTGIKEKKARGETLTAEEEKLYQKYKSYASAEAYLQWNINDDTFTSNDQTNLDSYAVKYSSYKSADEYLAQDATYQKLVVDCSKISENYEGWNADQLLFAIQESIINPESGVKTSSKDVNIYGNNINLVVKNGVGLNSAEEKVINLATLGEKDDNGNLIHLDDLKELATADASTVTWYKDEGKAVITKRLAIGVQQKKNETGVITVSKYGEPASKDSNVYIESRKASGMDDSTQNYDLKLNSIETNNGNVSVTSWGDIVNCSKKEGAAVISAKDLDLNAGAIGVVEAGSVGTADKPLLIDITGKLRAVVTGNIYLVNQGTHSMRVQTMVADPQGGDTNKYGNISLISSGDIYGYYDAQADVQGYIRGGTNGAIIISANGSIGSFGTINGIETDTLRIINSNDVNRIVKLYAKDDIVVEGVSVNVRNEIPANTPGGVLNVQLAGGKSQSVKITSNGALVLDQTQFTDVDSCLILGAVDLTLNGDYSADVISLTGSLGINQKSGTVKGREVTLIAGDRLDLTYRKMDVADNRLKDAEINQIDDGSTDAAPKVIAKILNVKNYGNISMNVEENQFAEVHLDAGKDVDLRGTAYTETTVLKSAGSAITDVQVDLKNSHANHNEQFMGLDYDDFTKGDVSIMLYPDSVSGATADLTINGNIHATGDIILCNDAGSLRLPSGAEKNKEKSSIYTQANLFKTAKGEVVSDKNIITGEGTVIVSDDDIKSTSEFTYAGGGMYLCSRFGDVYDVGMESIGIITGDLTLLAENGTVFNTRAYLTTGDITIKAKHDISNIYVDKDGFGMHSVGGNITIYSTGVDTNEGNLYNDQPMKADSGYIFLYASKDIYNRATIDARSGGATDKDNVGTVTLLSGGIVSNGDGTGTDYIYGENGVAIVTVTELENKADLYASKGDIVVGGVGDYVGEGAGYVTGTGKVTNTGRIYTGEGNILLTAGSSMENTGGSIYVSGTGNITIDAKTSLTNVSDIHTLKGNVTITAGADISNIGSIYTSSGEVNVQSTSGKVDNNKDSETVKGSIYTLEGNVNISAATTLKSVGDIYSLTGDVILNSGGDLTNTGSVYGYNAVELESENGNIVNSSKFSSTDVFSKNITLSALKGSVTNSSDLIAIQNIKVVAKNALSVTKPIYSGFGDIMITSFEGDVSNESSISTHDGNITVVGKKIVNFVNSDGILAEQHDREGVYGQVTLIATEDIINVDSSASDVDDALIYGQNGVYMLAGGKLYNRAVIRTDTGHVILDSTTIFSEVGLPLSVSGNTVENYGSIEVACKGNVKLTTDGYIDSTGALVGGKVSNFGAIQTAEGCIWIKGDGNITNTKTLLSSAAGDEGGDIELISIMGKIESTGGSITAQEGNVLMVAHKDNIENTADIIAGKDGSEVGGKVVLLSGGQFKNTGKVEATKDVYLYGYAGLDNSDVNASITTENGNVVINHYYNYDYADNMQWVDPIGDVKNAGSIIVNQKGNIMIGTERALTYGGKGDVENTGALITPNGDIVINSDGDIKNGTKGTIIALSGGNIKLVAKGTVSNAASIYSLSSETKKGKVELISKTGDVINEGLFGEKSRTSIAGVEFVIDGSILISAEQGKITNDKAMFAMGNITLRSKTSITNQAFYTVEGDKIGLYSDSGDIAIYTIGDGADDGVVINNTGLQAQNGSIFIYANKSVTNNGAIKAAVKDGNGDPYAGQVVIMSGGMLKNSKKIDADEGVMIDASGDIVFGEKDVLDADIVTKKGNIDITSTGGSVINYSNLTTGEGNVVLEAKGDVVNNGSIVAVGHRFVGEINDKYFSADTGWVALVSNDGNVVNTGKFDAAEVTYADGSIWMEAKNGSITNTHDLVAYNNIVLDGKQAVINETQQFGLTSLGTGDIRISATDTTDAGAIYNTGVIETTNGSIILEANGSTKKALRVYDEEVKNVAVSVYNGSNGHLKAKGGDVIITGERSIVNEGDISMTSTAVNTADLKIESTKGSVLLYDETVNSNATGKNTLEGNGDIVVKAKEGVVYNEKNIVTDGDIYIIYGGYDPEDSLKHYDSLVVDTEMTSSTGDIFVVTTAPGTNLEIVSDISADLGNVVLNSKGGLNARGDVSAPNGNINIGAVDSINVEGNLTGSLDNGLVALGTQNGATLDVSGKIVGNEVVLYTENKDTVMSFNEIVLGKELTLAGNHWRNDKGDSKDGSTIHMSKVTVDKPGQYDIRLFGAGGTIEGAKYDLYFDNPDKSLYTGYVHILQAVVDNLTIHTNGRVRIDDLAVYDRADIYTMGTKTSVYGQPHDYDSEAVTIYYASGKGAGAGIWLHDMFFDGTPESYLKVMNKYIENNTEGFVIGGNNGGLDGYGESIYLDIISPTEQHCNAKLLKTSYGMNVYKQRYSMEQLMQNLLNFKAMEVYNEYFNKGIELYQRYNLVDIPDVTVNQPVELKNGSFEVEGMSTDSKDKKVMKKIKYEF